MSHDGLCDNCHERPGTETWIGDGNAMSYAHGAHWLWCEICVLRAQIQHAKERAAEIPAMELRLKALEDVVR